MGKNGKGEKSMNRKEAYKIVRKDISKLAYTGVKELREHNDDAKLLERAAEMMLVLAVLRMTEEAFEEEGKEGAKE